MPGRGRSSPGSVNVRRVERGQRRESSQGPPCAPAAGNIPLPTLRGILNLIPASSALKARGDSLTVHTCKLPHGSHLRARPPSRPSPPQPPSPASEPAAPASLRCRRGPACGRYAPSDPNLPRPTRVGPDAARVATGAGAGRRLRQEAAAPPRAGRWAGPEEARGSAGRAAPRSSRGERSPGGAGSARAAAASAGLCRAPGATSEPPLSSRCHFSCSRRDIAEPPEQPKSHHYGVATDASELPPRGHHRAAPAASVSPLSHHARANTELLPEATAVAQCRRAITNPCQPQGVGARHPTKEPPSATGTAPIPRARKARSWVTAVPVPPSTQLAASPAGHCPGRSSISFLHPSPKTSGGRQGADVELYLSLSKSTLCTHESLELKDHVVWGWGTTGPGVYVSPTGGKVALSPVEQAPNSWSPTEGMVRKGQAVPALWGSEDLNYFGGRGRRWKSREEKI